MANYNIVSSSYLTLTDQTGSYLITSGQVSGSKYYTLIAPQYSTGSTTIKLTSFSGGGNNDILRIYNDLPSKYTASFQYTGSTVSGQLIGVISGSSPSLPQTFTVNSGKAYIAWAPSASAATFNLEWTGSGFQIPDLTSSVSNRYSATFPKNGANGSYMEFIPGRFTGSALTTGTDIIFGTWVKGDTITQAYASEIYGIYSLGTGPSNSTGPGIRFVKPSNSNDLQILVADSANLLSTLTMSGAFDGGGIATATQYIPQWHHYGFVVKRIGTNMSIRGYKDGQIFASGGFSITAGGNFATTQNHVVGAYRGSTNVVNAISGITLSGSIDDMFLITINSGSADTQFNSFFSDIYNSGSWRDPTLATGSLSGSLSPKVQFAWRFEETGSLLNTKDYGSFGNFHTASAVISASANLAPTLTITSSGYSYTPYQSLSYNIISLSNATVSFTTSSASVYENTASYVFGVQVLTASIGQSATASITLTSSAETTASLGTNYKLIYAGTTYSSSAQMPISIAWAANDTTTKYITASIIDNTTYTNTSASVPLKIEQGTSTNITVSSPFTFTLKILDYEEGNPSFTSSSYGTGEASGSITIYVDRLSGSQGPLSASYSTINGTAIAGTNYTTTTGTLSWADAETTRKSFSVPIKFDGVQTSSKYFTVTLSSISTGSFLPYAITSSTITIADQEQGTFSIVSSSYAVIEGNSTTVTVNRYSGSFAGVNVYMTSSNGTAVSGSDYNSIGQYLVFGDGETSKTLTVSTIDNVTDVPPPPLYFTVGISSLTPQYGLPSNVFYGTNSYTTIYITDNETGSIRFSNSSYTSSFGSTITIPVERYAGADFSATASVSRVGGTAIAGTDYTDIFPYTISWADQESGTKNISLTTLNTNIWNGDKTLVLQIGGLTNLNIGSIMTASALFKAGISQQSTPPLPNISADYTINNFTNISSQYTRRIEQIPMGFAIKGPASLRGSTFKVSKG